MTRFYALLPGRWVLLLSLLLVLAGCGHSAPDDDNAQPPEPTGQELFVSATEVAPMSQLTMQALARLGGYTDFVPIIRYDARFYRFIYQTTFQGQRLEVSGLLGIPQNTPAPPALLSAQHGTMIRAADAPSNYPATFSGFELFAGAGYVTLIPDFVGYGASQRVLHPYYDEQASARVVVDMLKAAKYYLNQQNVALNRHLFLVGYSEGGYVTMAAQKEIETNSGHGLTLTAAAAGAGGYDLTGMLTGIAAAPSYPNPAFLATIVRAYNTTYGWNRPLTDFFQVPYAAAIPTLLDGTRTLDEANAGLTTSPAALFAPAFYAALTSASGEPTLKQKLTDNSLLSWVPRSPTRLYHGTADESVFFQTSQTTYDRFRAAGATNVTFIPIPGGMHRTSIVPMLLDAAPWLESLNR